MCGLPKKGTKHTSDGVAEICKRTCLISCVDGKCPCVRDPSARHVEQANNVPDIVLID